ncbi:FAD/NAD(P)-binding protein [Streptomyces sp. JB150]|uniref:FAD/NAD(P)-binding protein n=1 Tax=Streptomyces sp. JB150 TaxID=2714844 RepID=UPI00140B6F92|nr:FAD/NAD(P)-binding protein [Streptomyces sp. JB150]QIJ64535.1 FAD/NAD(P)-binding protein [Streptomyces sp. JB150]
MTRPPTVAIIGAGPRGTSLLERLVANAATCAPDRTITVHVIDPCPPGGGRIWRSRQSPLLWMNTTSEDCTMFTDETVACEGPVVSGPTLGEWAREVAAGRLSSPPGFRLAPSTPAEARRMRDGWFTTRRTQSDYLSWVFWQSVRNGMPQVRVAPHEGRAVDVRDLPCGRQRVVLADGLPPVDADVVLFAHGNADVAPDAEEMRLTEYAAAHGLGYLPSGSSADHDYDRIPAGEPVIVRGLGLCFIDTAVLLTSGRGGTFRRDDSGELRYEPSGAEPVLFVGSRRGVPYWSKTHYSLTGPPPRPCGHLDAAALAALGDRPLDFAMDIWPLIVREVTHAGYRELAASHPELLNIDASEFLHRLDTLDWEGPQLKELVDQAVRYDEDRIDLAETAHPLAGRHFADLDALQRWMTDHLAAGVRRGRDPRYSASLAMLHGLSSAFAALVELVGERRLTPASWRHDLPRFLDLCRFLTSGPPGPRLEELLALTRAGIVRFLGAEMTVTPHEGLFRARSCNVSASVTARYLIEARLPERTLPRVSDPSLRSLLRRDEIREEFSSAPGGDRYPTGVIDTAHLIDTDSSHRLKRADGTPHPRRFGAGILFAGSVLTSGRFPSPRSNDAFFRQNDTIARAALRELCRRDTSAPGSRNRHVDEENESPG